MPNHCHNDLYIDGPADDVAALLEHIGMNRTTPTFDFNTLVQQPENLVDPNPRIKGEAVINWRCDHWGTKWNAYDVVRRDYDGQVCITFQTAWCTPSKELMAILHQKFPTVSLHVEWFECGTQECGGYAMKSREECFYEDSWKAGVAQNIWKSDYLGHRGG
jgi:hypothetical protein